eukprot:811404-Amphidinium_carterae.1
MLNLASRSACEDCKHDSCDAINLACASKSNSGVGTASGMPTKLRLGRLQLRVAPDTQTRIHH